MMICHQTTCNHNRHQPYINLIAAVLKFTGASVRQQWQPGNHLSVEALQQPEKSAIWKEGKVKEAVCGCMHHSSPGPQCICGQVCWGCRHTDLALGGNELHLCLAAFALYCVLVPITTHCQDVTKVGGVLMAT